MGTKKASSDEGLPLVWLFVLIFAAAALITAALLTFYSTQKTLVRKKVIDNLQMMVDYKGILIRRWYKGSRDDALRAEALPIIQNLVRNGPPGDPAGRRHFEEDLTAYAKSHGFAASGLVDGKGRWIPWSTGGNRGLFGDSAIVVKPRAHFFLTNFEMNEKGLPYLNAVVPLPAGRQGQDGPRAIVFVVNPWYNVFRSLSSSSSQLGAGTVLLQKTGGGVEIVRVDHIHPVSSPISDRRFKPDSPESQALSAFITKGESLDADGEKVFYATNYIPWVHWGVVATIKQSDAYSTIKLAAQFTSAMVILVFLSASFLLYALWNRRHRLVTAGMASDLREQKDLLEVTLRKLYTAVEAERRHLSHEIHDELAQLLSSAQMHLYALEQTLDEEKPAEVDEELQLARDRVARAGTECRKIIAGLRPPELDELGLVGAITALGGTPKEPQTDFRIEDTPRFSSLPEEVGMVLYRITQQALDNAKRHSGATRITVDMRFEGPFITLLIADDGRGFEPSSARHVLHFGLDGMRERALLVGGDFELASAPGEGTRISVRIPFVEREGQEQDDDSAPPAGYDGLKLTNP
jgi:signal transduction histidine kinase